MVVVHERSIWLELAAVAMRFVGALGGVVSVTPPSPSPPPLLPTIVIKPRAMTPIRQR